MTQVSKHIIRLKCDAHYATAPVEKLTQAQPVIYEGTDVEFQIGIFNRDSLMDASNITALSVEIRNAAGDTNPLILASTASLNSSLTLTQWKNDLDQHATLSISSTQNTLSGGFYWLSVIASTATTTLVLSAGSITVKETALGGTPTGSLSNYYTKVESDGRYIEAANNLNDLDNVATARTNLGLGTIATQDADSVSITGGAISGITDLAVADGGTGASDASGARTNLGVYSTTEVDALFPSFNVRTYGAVGDDSTDDTSAIQSAITAANVAGGTVFFPAGTYKTTSALTLSVSGVNLEGVGTKSIIKLYSATGNTVEITGGNCFVRDLQFNSGTTKTADSVIELSGVNLVTLQSLTMYGAFNGVLMTGAGGTGNKVIDVNILNCVAGGSGIRIDTTSNGIDYYICNILITAASSGAQMDAGIRIDNLGDIVIDRVSTIYTGTGLKIIAPASETVQAVMCSNCYFDQGSAYGVYIAGNSGDVDLVKLSNIWSCTNTNSGIALVTSGGTVNRVEMSNCTLSNNTHGLFINDSGPKFFSLNNSTCSGNSQNGVYVAGGVTDFQLVQNVMGAAGEFTVNGQYGIYLATGASDRYIITNNIIRANTSGQLSDNGTGTNKVITNNITT